MSSLKGKKILLGVTGSIAAYKSAVLVRDLIKLGAEVKVITTASAEKFITSLTLSTLSGNAVLSDLIDQKGTAWNNHVEVGLWADVYVVAPASAHSLAKMAQGLCDNMLTAAYLSARCPVVVAPAMDLDMYKHPATIRNLEVLKQDGVHVIDAREGELASGLVGQGRMAEPAEICEFLHTFFNER